MRSRAWIRPGSGWPSPAWSVPGPRIPCASALAAVLARLGQPAEAWQSLEEDLGRGLLDELAARQDRRLTPAERARLRELTAELERLDKLVEATPKGLDQAERAKRFEELKRQRELASIALGEFQTKLVQDHGALAGQVARLNEIQAALPADAALVAWVDIPPAGPNAADPDGEHWGVVVRSRGIPAWVPIAGTGPDGLWTNDDTGLADRVRTELRRRPGAGPADLRPLVERLRTQRLDPLAKALGTTADGLPPARRLIVLPSRAMAGIPVEALLAPDDTRMVSYAPSATVFKYLREQPRPDRHAGLLALGDPVYERPDTSSEPQPLPDHGLLVNVVAPGSNAATHGLKTGRCLAGLQRPGAEQEGRPQGRGRGRQADCRRRLERRPVVPARTVPRQARRRVRPPAGTEAIAAESSASCNRCSWRRGRATKASPPCRARATRSRRSPGSSSRRSAHTDPARDRCERGRARPPGRLGRAGSVRLHPPGDARGDRRSDSRALGRDPDPNRTCPIHWSRSLNHKPVFDGRLSVREIQRGWDLKAELVTLSACETALGRDAGGEGFVGFTQALLMSGTRSVCLSLWKVDDTATALLMQRFYANLLGRRPGLTAPMPKAEALREAKVWLRGLPRSEVLVLDRRALGRRRPVQGSQGPPAGRARRDDPRRRGQRPSVRTSALLGRVRAGRRPGLISSCAGSLPCGQLRLGTG